MSEQAIPETTLMDIRQFLGDAHSAPAPWCGHQRVIDALYSLLYQKRNNNNFWKELGELASRLEERQFRLRPVWNSQVLAEATVDTLLTDLRQGLLQHAPERPQWKRFLGSIGTTGLLGFLLLGTATACSDYCEEEVRDEGISHAETYCDMVRIIQEADVAWTVRTNLLDCLPQLDEHDRAYTLEQFQSASDEDLAAYLEELSTSDLCDDDLKDYGSWNDH